MEKNNVLAELNRLLQLFSEKPYSENNWQYFNYLLEKFTELAEPYEPYEDAWEHEIVRLHIAWQKLNDKDINGQYYCYYLAIEHMQLLIQKIRNL